MSSIDPSLAASPIAGAWTRVQMIDAYEGWGMFAD